MGKKLALKLLLIGLIFLVLMLPLGMLDGLVAERQARGWEVAAEISASAGSEQLLIGPLLVIDAVRSLRREKTVTEAGSLRQISEVEQQRERTLLAPRQLGVEASLSSERRSRGPFDALLYHSKQRLSGEFVTPAPPSLDAELIDYRIERVQLVLAVGDNRGINAIQVQVNGTSLAVEPGTGLSWPDQGVSVHLTEEWVAGQSVPFDIELDLSGSRALNWVPLADENAISLRGDWPHPGFVGSTLPQRRQIQSDGFSANWQISRLASGAQQILSRCAAQTERCQALRNTGFGLRLVDPVDRYLMTDRAIKYGLLFLLIIFAAVFFIEVTAAVTVHPMQYGLTGMALAIFFLLLLALSEHIGFASAYSLAALGCGGLIGHYMSAVLGGVRRGLAFAVSVLALYGLLYGLLQSEDFALLLGAVVLFAMLALVMISTRRFDWSRFELGRGGKSPDVTAG